LTKQDKNAAIAAALILVFVAFGLMAMPTLVIGLANAVSPFAGAALALAFILAPFGVLWVRSKYQQKAK
jgi:uncharacterized membrane protein YqjE